jgi:hypothetical protein
MTDNLAIVIVIGGAYLAFVLVVEALAAARVRSKIAERGLSAGEIDALLRRRIDGRASLRWGLVTVAIGLALVVVQLLPAELRGGPIGAAVIFLFAGGALVAHSRMGGDGEDA